MAAGLCPRLGGSPSREKPDRGPPSTHIGGVEAMGNERFYPASEHTSLTGKGWRVLAMAVAGAQGSADVLNEHLGLLICHMRTQWMVHECA